MKLYTENDLKRAIKRAYLGSMTPFSLLQVRTEILENLTPIKLPSDEEIEKENPFVFGSHVFGTRDLMVWELGAKWMRNKIQGGDK